MFTYFEGIISANWQMAPLVVFFFFLFNNFLHARNRRIRIPFNFLIKKPKQWVFCFACASDASETVLAVEGLFHTLHNFGSLHNLVCWNPLKQATTSTCVVCHGRRFEASVTWSWHCCFIRDFGYFTSGGLHFFICRLKSKYFTWEACYTDYWAFIALIVKAL